ncbi:MFS transporter [Prochlorococcus marinus]|uniref:MFS transporter n=1 Tax=Prochlorococcus marinus TaxID=1219 RepID=UPI0022B57F11|nr:MFS transporter [Prochlorococcus marinus]
MSQIFSQLADKLYIVLSIYLISKYWVDINQIHTELIEIPSSNLSSLIEIKTNRITLLATGVYIANTLPAILIGGISGIIVDFFQKIKVLYFTNLMKGLLMLLIPICILPGPSWKGCEWGYWAFLFITFISSCLTQILTPAEQSIIPILVPKNNLITANSIYQSTNIGAIILGFSLGEVFLLLMKAFFGFLSITGGEFLLLPIFYFIASSTIRSVKLKENIENMLQPSKRNIIDQIKKSFRLLENNIIKKSLTQIIFVYCLLASLYILSIHIASTITSLGPTRFGVLLGFNGLGIALGAIYLTQTARVNQAKTPNIGFLIIAFSLIALGLAQGSILFCTLFCTLIGIGTSFIVIPAQTRIQKNTPTDQLGKIFGLQNNLNNIAIIVPLLSISAFLNKFGLIPLLIVLAALSFYEAFNGHIH